MWTRTLNFLRLIFFSIMMLFIVNISFLSFKISYLMSITIQNNTEFEYIIVGAGTAGLTILSGMETFKVLILEAGGSTNFILDIPIITPALQRTKYDYSFKTETQIAACKGLNNSSSIWASGKGFGGSNILNNLIYYRGHTEDFRGWFNDMENYDYSLDIMPYFLKNENYLPIDEIKYNTKLGKSFLKMNIENNNPWYFEKVKLTKKNNKRHSFAHQYKMNDNKNHTILLHTQVLRLIFDKNDKNKVIGVEYQRDNSLKSFAYAKKGVILTAGTIGTPFILMHSGIGICKDLKKISIDCIANLPVGQNLQDHITTGIDLVKVNQDLGFNLNNLLNIKTIYNYFSESGFSAYSSAGCEVIGFTKEINNRPNELGFMVIPLGIIYDQGTYMRYILNINNTVWDKYFEKIINNYTISLLPILLHPKSRGYIKLKNNDYKSSPIINPMYLSHPNDIEILYKGIRIIQKIIKNDIFQEFDLKFNKLLFPGCENFDFDTQNYWYCYIRHLTLTVYHPVGTCKIGSSDDPTVVVNRKFQVKSFNNLYVADASIMPNLPSGNPNAVVSMIARKFLSVLKEKYSIENFNKKAQFNIHDEF